MLTWHVASDPVQAIWREKQGCVRVCRNEVNTYEEFASTDAQSSPSGQGQHAVATCGHAQQLRHPCHAGTCEGPDLQYAVDSRSLAQ